ncbi:MAG: EAL domain-containing protein [Alphaproteobacteria bacterium]
MDVLTYILFTIYALISCAAPWLLTTIHPEYSFAIWFLAPVVFVVLATVHMQYARQRAGIKSFVSLKKQQETLSSKISAMEEAIDEVQRWRQSTEQQLEEAIVEEIQEVEETSSKPSCEIVSDEDLPQDNNFTQEEIADILLRAVKSDRIEMMLQPIVSLPQRKLKYYECFSRIRDNNSTILLPDHYLAIAEQESVIRIIDNTLLLRCTQLIKKARKQNYSANFFCNLSLHTIKDQNFFDNFVEFIRSNQSMAKDIIFEFDMKFMNEWCEEVEEKLKRLSRLGCRFSLDQITSLNLDVKRLKGLNFTFLKIDIGEIQSHIKDDLGRERVAKFKKLVDQYKLEIIITKIEDEDDLLEVLDYEFDYGQGYLFCPPRLHQT